VDQRSPARPQGHRRVDRRRVRTGLICRRRTGGPWQQRPTRFGDDSTVPRHCQRWCHRGIFEQRWAVLVQACDELGGVDWPWQAADPALGKARVGGDVVGRHPTARGQQGGNAASWWTPPAVHGGWPWREPTATLPSDSRRRARPLSLRGQPQRPRRLSIAVWIRATIIPRALKWPWRILTRRTAVSSARQNSMNAGESGSLRGAGSWNEQGHGSPSVVRC
jgi:putative transposase of IS4/5 family DUF4096